MLRAYQDKEFPTIATVGKRLDPDGRIAKIAEIMSRREPMLRDIPWVEGNLPTGHKSTIRTALPGGNFREFNAGVPTEHSETQQIIDTTAMLESYAEIDKALADLNGNRADWRLSEEKAFIEGLSQTAANTFLYGNPTVDPKVFKGFAPRYYTLDRSISVNADYIIDGQGTGPDNLTSIWLINWSPETVFGIYPKGSKAGLSFEDKGQVTITGDGGQFEGYRTHYVWHLGLAIRDYRSVVRIANIDIENVTVNALIDLMVEASELIRNKESTRPVFYMNRRMRTKLRTLILSKTNAYYSFDDVEGRKIQFFDDIAVETTDAITLNEARVV